MEEKPKVIVIGLDGATWDLIKPWTEEGKLPTFRKLMEKGAWGVLESTIPPMSPPAWATIITGVRPDKHGIPDFYYFKSGNLKIVNSKDIASKKIWEVLDEYGHKQIIMNVPITYPPDKVSGCFISGMLTPSMESEFTYPSELKTYLLKKGYEIETDPEEGVNTVRWKLLNGNVDVTDIVMKYNKDAWIKLEILVDLIKKEKPNFVFFVLTGTDRLQHYLMGRDEILSHYMKIDDIIKRIIDLNYFDDMILISDHGFSKIKKIFYLNTFLFDRGVLVPKGRLILLKSRIIIYGIKLIKKLSKIGIPVGGFLAKQKLKGVGIAFDATKSKCYMYSHTSCGFFINERMGEKENIKQKLIRELNGLKDSDGSCVLEAIPREKLYSGAYSNKIPDILLKFKKGYTVSDFLIPPSMIRRGNYLLSPENGPSFKNGDHTNDGIILLHGKHFNFFNKKSKINVHVEDIFPTILYLFGISIPHYVDGKPIFEAFNKGFLEKNPPTYQIDKVNTNLSKAIKRVKEKLKKREK